MDNSDSDDEHMKNTEFQSSKGKESVVHEDEEINQRKSGSFTSLLSDGYSSDDLMLGGSDGEGIEDDDREFFDGDDQGGSDGVGAEYEDREFDSGDDQDKLSQVMEESPGGCKYYIPTVDDSLKPKIGDSFATDAMAEAAYRKYALAVGFDVRLSNRKTNKLGIVTMRYLVCNKQGAVLKKTFDSMEVNSRKRRHRNSNLKRSGCLACLKFHFVKARNRYEVYQFTERHNHLLYSEHEMSLSKAKRGLTYVDHRNVFHAVSSKVGVAKSHRMSNAVKGGVESSGGTVKDYQNFKKDMVTFVGDKDAQMLINTMVSRKKCCPDFFFEFKCNQKELVAIFWADEIAKLNFREFGDVISFDATFRTNKHAMIFVPFVAVDNHKKSVVVGAALIRKEKVPYYTWVLNAFKKAHGGQPRLVVTDQCPAMKQAIPIAFPDSIHRLCMWHITKKIKSKVGVYLQKETTFVSDVKRLIWDLHIEPDEFEEKWNNLMDEFGLRGDSWFEEMFKIRESWIPAYFKDTPMSGLMKTTSRSESINAFFNVYAAFWNDLVIFLRSFDMAIEAQRKSHCSLEVKTKSTNPRMISPSKLEAFASNVYTRTIFFEVQKELNKASWFCGVVRVEDVEDKQVYTISHCNKEKKIKKNYKVVFDKADGSVDCSCNMFVRNGILCRHAFKVLLNNHIDVIPDQYVLRRWRRDLIPPQWLPARVRYGEIDVDKERLMGSMFSLVERMIEAVMKDKSAFKKLVDKLTLVCEEVETNATCKSSTQRKKDDIENLLGVEVPDNVDVFPPIGIRNKGCGRGKRLKSVRERAEEKAKKPKRLCRTCGETVRHDSRNCPMR